MTALAPSVPSLEKVFVQSCPFSWEVGTELVHHACMPPAFNVTSGSDEAGKLKTMLP